ncbi:MAG: hypothetical protein V1807_02460 [Patescibacteria group bacterium]
MINLENADVNISEFLTLALKQHIAYDYCRPDPRQCLFRASADTLGKILLKYIDVFPFLQCLVTAGENPETVVIDEKRLVIINNILVVSGTIKYRRGVIPPAFSVTFGEDLTTMGWIETSKAKVFANDYEALFAFESLSTELGFLRLL